MSTRSQQKIGIGSLVLLALAFVVAVSVSNVAFRGWRIDLTEDRLYTLSDGTRAMLAKIEEPINLYFYYSDQASANVPAIRRYAERVRDMLEEFADAAGSKINLSVIDPVPFSEEEDRAARFGLQGVALGVTPDPVYLGLAGTDSVDNEEIIAFFQPDKEPFLEYDIAKLISTLANPERTVVGLVSGVEMTGGFDPVTQRMAQPWVVYQQAEQLFEIRNLGTSFEEIASDISLLWLVQPRGLDSKAVYAIDQFIVTGGKALIFVDPLADVDVMDTEGMPQGMPPMGQGSDLPELFAAWGIEFAAQEVVADAQLALQISGRDRRPLRHYGYLGIDATHMNAEDIITADLDAINMATAGYLKPAEDAAATFEPLFVSSTSSEPMPATRFSYLPDPSSLQQGFVAGGEELTLAARVGGIVPSAFPDGPPQNDDNAGADGDDATDGNDTADDAAHIAAGSEPANLIVVADVDMLSDQLWVQVQNFFGQQIASAFAANGSFVINALENLSGSSDLITVRSRNSYARPFSRVAALRAEAEARFRQTEQRLQDELAETENRLRELQSSREDSGNILLTDEQQDEIDRFVAQRGEIRTELRAVQRGLDRDIERLGTILKIINIALVPLLLTAFVLIALWQRERREPA
jgi:ABC-type uncharacterized transport system involved in gliding motility auxiliary subunit